LELTERRFEVRKALHAKPVTAQVKLHQRLKIEHVSEINTDLGLDAVTRK
jgi:hypothetical protein